LGLFTLAGLLFFHPEDLSFYTSHPSDPVKNYTGVAGAYVAFGLFVTFGIAAFLIPAFFLLWSGCFFLQKVPERKVFKFSGLGLALFSLATLVTISVEPALRFARGGAVGYMAGSHLLRYFGHVGSYIVTGSCLLLSLLLATDFLLYPLVKKLMKNLSSFMSTLMDVSEPWREKLLDFIDIFRIRVQRQFPQSALKARSLVRSSLPDTPLKVKKYDPHVSEAAEKLKAEVTQEISPSKKMERPKKIIEIAARDPGGRDGSAQTKESAKPFEGVIASALSKLGEYNLPPIELLKKSSATIKPTDDLQQNSKILERTLEEFGISVKVVEVEQGPVITRYELLPAPGVKVNSISALSDDIALALKAMSVRLIVPIPGKAAVGVEVPNSVSNIVSLREMIESQAFQSRKAKLPLVLGKTTDGRPLVADLSSMPHLLIAGSTGSGKTVCVNSIIMGLIYHASPEDLKFVMIDPKMVELSVYNDIPHMLAPVVTDVRKAARTLNWVANEMENRFRLFATCGVRNIDSFNSRPISEETVKQISDSDSKNVVPAKLPHIIIVIDELADLMMVARDKVEAVILRLAQLARAVGIHLILATQRPSVDVITGVIKANFPARLSFKVSSKVDSRTVLDANGADKLIGRGDMLLMQPGDPKPVRGQAPLVTDQEINNVVKFISEQASPEFHAEITQAVEDKTSWGSEEKDELFEEAVRVILETRQASTSNLQRRMRLGYTRAARIIDQMEAEGIVGPAQGAKPREIFVSSENTEEAVESQ